MAYLFTSESVSEGHPDKVADQISDAILDQFLAKNSASKVACEVLCTTGLVVVSGEVNSDAYVDLQSIVRGVVDRIGYTKSEYKFNGDSCSVISALHEQSSDINQGVVRELEEDQGAGDQGIMFGYACYETKELMPASLMLSHYILLELAAIRREGKVMTYLRPDSKSQITVEYNNENVAQRIHTVVVSTQHDEFILPSATKSVKEAEVEMQQIIKDDVKSILIPRVVERLEKNDNKLLLSLLQDDYILHVNPTGKFIIGGPHGDTGLTGRKIIVDTYGGRGAHGGGAFSGKDSSKVDRSAAYAARHIAKNMVAAGVASEFLLQLSYAIGVAQPLSIFVNTYGTSNVNLTDGEIAEKIAEMFDFRPAMIIKRYGLRNPIFEQTAAYGHFGRDPYMADVKVWENGKETIRNVKFFAWEELDEVDFIKESFKSFCK